MNNNQKALEILNASMPDLMMIKELMDANDIPIQEVMRALVLVANVKKMAQWGKVVILLKEGEITAIQQEQQFITTREAERMRK